MKIISDYFKFEDYKNKAKEEFLPKLDEIVKKKNSSSLQKIAVLQKDSKKLIIIFSISLFLTFIIILSISLAEVAYITLIFAIIPGIIAFFSAFYFWMKKKEIWSITNEISKDVIVNFRPEDAYKTAFSILDKGMDYLGFYDQLNNNFLISGNEVRNFTPAGTIGSADAWISEIRPVKQLLIDKKFHVAFTNIHWEWEEEIEDEDGKVKTVIRHSYTGFLKIDTSILGEKAFDFKLLKPNGWLSQKEKIQLENEEFNKVFNPQSSDRLKIRKMYTPLAMELPLKRYSDRNGVKVLDVAIESLGNAIYFTYKCDWNFMYLDFPTSIIKTPDDFINHIFNDFLLDTYSLYYLLCLIYVTLYLD
ncbi:hypothetical protein [Mesomycoplasma ovipneumoniae]|uniref:hypothetical protein n=2 Tax=Mesomycoplasma ovipneumoniae TaxID=29562 RepID=UPI0029656B69|nr:hypothetical protein [Mesomycoplasma ovipneumoniae]MDW2928590.1 DUF3137 domain-containing protein [Mesomycoplasma ovipneumoniae]